MKTHMNLVFVFVLFFARLGRQGIIEKFCNFAKVYHSTSVFLIFSLAKQGPHYNIDQHKSEKTKSILPLECAFWGQNRLNC